MEQLKELYYNPKTGLISANKLYFKLNKKVPLAKIKEFISNQEIHQLLKSITKEKAFKRMIVYSANNQWQIDLIDFSRYSHWNSGFKYLFCIIDVFSRKAFVIPLKSKSNTSDAMRSLLVSQKPILIQSDNGTEFLNNKFQELLKQNNIQHSTAQVGDHNKQGIVERFNKTIQSIITKYQETRKTNRYLDVLGDIVFNYNNTFHTTIKDTPERRFVENSSKGFFKTTIQECNLKIGDRVRILKEKHFKKEVKQVQP